MGMFSYVPYCSFFSFHALVWGAVDSLPRYKINTRYGLSMKVMANWQNYVETLLLFRIERGLLTGKYTTLLLEGLLVPQ